MELRPLYPDDIVGECRRHAAALDPNSSEQRRWRLTALAVADLVDALQSEVGPTKWVRLNHYCRLAFFAFNQFEFPCQHPQVIVTCGPFREDVGFTEIMYLLPAEHRPWKWATTDGFILTDVVPKVLDGFSRCESRQEHLIFQEST